MAAVALALAVMACDGSGDGGSSATREPAPISDHAGAVCGMLVRDQPAPRGQVLHRDGTRHYVCSLGDLLVHLSVPSPNGPVEGVWVERMSPDEDPLQSDPAPHEWIAAGDAIYVVGVPRKGIMGPPILSYGDGETARRTAARFPGARQMDFEGLRAWWRERN